MSLPCASVRVLLQSLIGWEVSLPNAHGAISGAGGSIAEGDWVVAEWHIFCLYMSCTVVYPLKIVGNPFTAYEAELGKAMQSSV